MTTTTQTTSMIASNGMRFDVSLKYASLKWWVTLWRTYNGKRIEVYTRAHQDLGTATTDYEAQLLRIREQAQRNGLEWVPST
jgi:hypothetical protein